MNLLGIELDHKGDILGDYVVMWPTLINKIALFDEDVVHLWV